MLDPKCCITPNRKPPTEQHLWPPHRPPVPPGLAFRFVAEHGFQPCPQHAACYSADAAIDAAVVSGSDRVHVWSMSRKAHDTFPHQRHPSGGRPRVPTEGESGPRESWPGPRHLRGERWKPGPQASPADQWPSPLWGHLVPLVGSRALSTGLSVTPSTGARCGY